MSEADLARTLWREQSLEHDPMTVAQIRERTLRLRRKVRVRNATEYVAAVGVVVWFGWSAIASDLALLRLGNLLVVLGTAYAAFQLSRRGGANETVAGFEGAIRMYRAQLVRQRDALRSVHRWYLAPFLPGLLLTLFARPLMGQGGWPAAGLGFAISSSVLIAIWGLNAYAANRFQAEIEDLDRGESK